MKRVLGVIPARGGSKGIPRKNVRLLGAIPLIVHTIKAAHASERLTRVLVSTDDDEIAEIALGAGAQTPFRRPSHLSGDVAEQAGVATHALSYCEEEEGVFFDTVVLLQPTTPLRSADDIDATVALLDDNPSLPAAITVTPVGPAHPNYMYRKTSEPHVLHALAPAALGLQRQSFEEVFVRNGAVYAVRRDHLLHEGSLMNVETLAHVMPRERSVNIDTEFDFLLAEHLLRLLHAGSQHG